MVMTHLANVTDRIDRSYSPRGGREERELDVLSSKIAAAPCRFNVYSRKVDAHRVLLQGGSLSLLVHA
jgi:hypothetical protein